MGANDGIPCSGECIPVTRLEGRIKGLVGRINLVLWFLGGTITFQAGSLLYADHINNTLSEFKETHAIQRGEDMEKVQDGRNTANTAFRMIKSHFDSKLPEKSRTIHAEMNQRINDNTYEIKLFKEIHDGNR